MNTHATMLVDATQGLKFTESPRWHEGKLWFLDIHDQRIKTVDLRGQVETVLALPFIPNGFGLTPKGGVIVGDAFQRRIYRWEGTALQPVADISNLTTYCLSDGIVDAMGRLYVGDIGYNFADPAAKPVETCVIVLVPRDGAASVVANGLFFPNGMVITRDGRTLIVGETLGHRLTAFDIQDDGSLGNRRVWAQLPDDVGPDGICLDAQGAVWVANPEGQDKVVRVRQGGEITDRIDVDAHAYAVMLGGPERRHLFICASGSHDPAEIQRQPSATLQVVEVDVPGAGIP
jgi:sugar lactone lactonase YvrE